MTKQADLMLYGVRRLNRFFAGCAAFLAFWIFHAAAPAAAATERRVALVIGNSTYQAAPALPNPKNDAGDFAATLKSVGFEVIEANDVDKRGMDTALAQFSRAARGSSVALFYFAGHGMQYNGVNYILPVDAKLEDEVGLRYESVSLDQVRAAVDEASGVKIMILDACRNNPLAVNLARSFIASSRAVPVMRGLARVEQSTGTVVAYATQANQVAEDGGGRNSPFTTALIENMREPGVEIASMFRRVANSVYEKTQGRQVPELSISLLSDFYLNQTESDMQAWARIRDKADVPTLRDFIQRFPNSLLTDAARSRLDSIETSSRDRYAREERDLRERLAALQRERAAVDGNKSVDTAPALPVIATAPTVVAGSTISIEPVQQTRVASNPDPAPVVTVTPVVPTPIVAAVAPQAQTVASLTPLAPAPAPAGPPAPQTQTALLTPPVAPAVASAADDPALFSRFKSEMRRLGCYGAANEKTWDGAGSKKAISLFAREAGLTITPVRLDGGQLDGLQTRKSRLCPSLCNVRQVENSAGSCVAKTCRRGEVLDRDGDCVDRAPAKRTVAKPPATRNVAQPRVRQQQSPDEWSARGAEVTREREQRGGVQRRSGGEQIETVRRSAPCSPGVSVGFGFGPLRVAAPIGRSC